jgi:hypothetical protein
MTPLLYLTILADLRNFILSAATLGVHVLAALIAFLRHVRHHASLKWTRSGCNAGVGDLLDTWGDKTRQIIDSL